MKTDIEIKQEVLDQVQTTPLSSAVRGAISATNRPFGSKGEDIVISVLASDAQGDIQTAIVVVNIYVPMVRKDRGSDEDTERLGVLSKLAASCLRVWRAADSSVYSLQRQNIFPIEGTNEHVISNRVHYKHLNE